MFQRVWMLCLLLLVLTATNCSAPDEQVLAYVGSQAITVADMQVPGDQQGDSGAHYAKSLYHSIQRELIDQAAASLGIEVTQAELDAEIMLLVRAGTLEVGWEETLRARLLPMYAAMERYLENKSEKQQIYNEVLKPLGFSQQWWDDQTSKYSDLSLDDLAKFKEEAEISAPGNIKSGFRRSLRVRKVLDAKFGTVLAVPAVVGSVEEAKKLVLSRMDDEGRLVGQLVAKALASGKVRIVSKDVRAIVHTLAPPLDESMTAPGAAE